MSLPSKRIALHAPPSSTPTLIARSDANAEDLEQYAAAGLYDRWAAVQFRNPWQPPCKCPLPAANLRRKPAAFISPLRLRTTERKIQLSTDTLPRT